MDNETLYLLAKSQAGAVAILDSPGAPSTGTWFTGNLALDSLGVLYVCEAGGTPGTWVQATSQWLTPVSKSSSFTAANGDYVEATAPLTVTSPAVTAGNRFGAIANYAASNASPVTLTAASGYFIGPGIPSDTSSIILGAENANVSFVSDGTNWLLASGAQDSGWITPAYQNGYSDYNQSGYRLMGNIVRMRGVMDLGTTGEECFALPSGWAPLVYTAFILPTLGSFIAGNLDIESGTCYFNLNGSGPAFLSPVLYTVD